MVIAFRDVLTSLLRWLLSLIARAAILLVLVVACRGVCVGVLWFSWP